MKAVSLRRAHSLAVSAVLAISLGALSLPCLAYASSSTEPVEPEDGIEKNTTKYDLNLNVTNDGTDAEEGRKKDEDWSVFVNISSIGDNYCNLYIDGSHYKNKEKKWKNCTVNEYAVAKRTGKFSIQSYVNENGYEYARITAWGKYGETHVHGAWKPDCKTTYTCINA